MCSDSLPKEIRKLAHHNYALLKESSEHPSLHFKPVCKGRYRSVRVGLHYRALGVPVPDGVQWFWIGSHAEYDKLLSEL
ncbi:MAG: ParE family toxin-like protein [Candidatus Scalindua sp.]